MEQRKSKRSVRVALVLGAAVAGTALVGWGGLAAWQAYTQNAGNAFTTGSIGHTNVVKGGNTTCTSTSAENTICNVIVSGSGLDWNWPGVSNTVAITDTASLPSTFTLSTPADPSGLLCSYLTLEVTGSGSDNSTYVNQQAGIGSIPTSTSLNTNAGSSSWNLGNSNTFNFAVGTTASYSATNSGAVGQSCTFSVLSTQAA